MSEPLLLALDTATRRASVAVCRGTRLLAQGSREVTTHSEGLLALIDETLRQAGVTVHQLELFVCGSGPGSFTGLRIGMATVKGLCLATSRPLVTLSSLWALALALTDGPAVELPPGQLVAAVIDARRDEIYVGLFRDGVLLGPPTVCGPTELARLVQPPEPVVLVGDGARVYRERLPPSAVVVPDDRHRIDARHFARPAMQRVAAGALDDPAAAVPLYIRPTDARLPSTPQDRRDAGP